MSPDRHENNLNLEIAGASHRPSERWQICTGLSLVAFVAAVIFFVQLGQCQLWDRDEPRNAGCAAEMMQRGDWVVPIFNGELRYQKPVMLYWLMMGAYQVFGISEWSARFWSALMGVGTVALTFGIARRLFDHTTAVLSGVILATSVMFVVASRAATPDALLIFFSTATIFFFVMGCVPRTVTGGSTGSSFLVDFRMMKFRWLLLMGTSMGLGILAKGPIGFLMPMANIGMFLLLIRQIEFYRDRGQGTAKLLTLVRPFHPAHFWKTTLAMRPFTLALIALATALPWYIWVGIRTEGDFLRIFFLTEHLGRSTSAFENHSGGVWFYPVAILIGFFPWSLFWLPVALIVWRLMRNSSAVQGSFVHTNSGIVLMLCWAGVQVALFTMAQTKLPSYVTPCYPALAMVTAATLVRWARQPNLLSRGWMTAAFATALAVGIVIAVGLGIAGQRFVGQPALAIVGIPVAVAGAVGLLLHFKGQSYNSLVGFAACGGAFALLLFGYATGQIADLQNNQNILSHVRRLPAGEKFASYGCLESSWIYYAGRPVYELETAATTNDLISERKFWQPKPRPSVRQFAADNPDSPVITTSDALPALERQLPVEYEVVAEADYFLKNKKLLLLKRLR